MRFRRLPSRGRYISGCGVLSVLATRPHEVGVLVATALEEGQLLQSR